MKIYIKSEKLSQAIKEAEGKARVRTVTAEDIERILDNISNNIPKAKLHGTKVFYDGAEKFPNAYKYIPESTHWTAENCNGRWYVTDIYRGKCPNKINNTFVKYSEEAKQRILQNASNYSF